MRVCMQTQMKEKVEQNTWCIASQSNLKSKLKGKKWVDEAKKWNKINVDVSLPWYALMCFILNHIII